MGRLPAKAIEAVLIHCCSWYPASSRTASLIRVVGAICDYGWENSTVGTGDTVEVTAVYGSPPPRNGESPRHDLFLDCR
jgi:hypothetical protein